MRIRSTLALAGLLALVLTSCASGGTVQDGGDTSSGQAAQKTQISIAAATSLTDAFNEIAGQFEAEHPEIDIAEINYDGSSTLATQITSGAPVDVFASADERNMQTVSGAGLSREPQIFATNTLVIAVPKGNPAKVSGLADLAKVTTVLCAPEVPCGAAGQKLLDNAGVQVQAASLEQNVGAVLVKVAAGEADAGLVYRTDVADDPQVDSIVPPGAEDVVNSYPISVLKPAQGAKTDPAKQEAARQFMDFVLGEQGQAVLADHGFGSPSDASSSQGRG